MILEMTDAEIDDLLRSQRVGRLGCRDGEETYVVPVIFAWHERHVYVYTTEGKKVTLMRRHERVCFEVDEYLPNGGWRSVILHGAYEELHGDGAARTLAILSERLAPAGDPRRQSDPGTTRGEGRVPVAFRIRADTISGRKVDRDS